MNIDITGLPKHAVVAALWNAARAQSVFDHKSAMSESRAREVAAFMESKLPSDRLDWVDGRVLKVDLRYDSFDPVFYDRDNGGEGAAARAIERLRQYNYKVSEHGIQQKVPQVDPSASAQVHGDGKGEAPHEKAISDWEGEGGRATGPDEEGPNNP